MIEKKRFFPSSFSVRARIVALALIPVAGFLANVLAFTSGEADVQTAFASVHRAAALSEASNDFKDALAAMRLTVRDFAFQPDSVLAQNFEENRKLAEQSLDHFEGSLSAPERKEAIGLRSRLNDVVVSFNALVKEHTTLGFTSDDGLNKQLQNAGQAVDAF